MKKNLVMAAIAAVAIVSIALTGKSMYESRVAKNDTLLIQNIEALSNGESGAKCPNGCKNIGWGFDKILECDCNYDHFSICKNWGC